MMTETSSDHHSLRAAAAHLLDQLDDLVGLAGHEAIENLRRMLERPPLAAIAGRVNTGKSTLVNALISTRVAPTSAQETTALLTCYAYGAPARAEALLNGGRVVQLPFLSSGPAISGTPVESIDYLRVFLQSAALQQFTILDTPGLGSAATSNSKRTEAGLLNGADPWTAPDVLIYMAKDGFRPDDEDFIRRFISNYRESPVRSPVVGLLSHADNFGTGPWDASDPIEEARRTAADLAAENPEIAAVIPVSGLLAETVRTGALREEDVRILRLLREVEDARLQFAEQLGPPPGIMREQYRRLTNLIGGYGVRFGRSHCESSAELLGWLVERSGLKRLEEVLTAFVKRPAERIRVQAMLSGLSAAARNGAWPREARALIESARHAPAFHQLKESEALDSLRAVAPQHELVAVLEELRDSDRWPSVLSPDIPDVKGIMELAARYQSMVASASTGAEAQAARVVCRSLLIRSGVTG